MATYYISPSGSDLNSCAQAQSDSTPKRTFSSFFACGTAADTFILLDGAYGSAAGTGGIADSSAGYSQIANSAAPPNGTSTSAMTIVRAQNPGSVVLTSRLFLGTSTTKRQYIKIQDLLFDTGTTGAAGQIYNTTYVYIKNTGFHSVAQTGSTVFVVGTSDGTWGNTYDLIEDSWIWGKMRIVANNYRSDNNVWRRVLLRSDGCTTSSCTGSGNPNVTGITIYDSKDVSLQNVMAVDSLVGGTAYADFATAQHGGASYPLGPNEWLGTISLNSENNCYNFEASIVGTNSHVMRNVVAWDCGVGTAAAGTGYGINMGSTANNPVIENFTVGKSHYTGGTVANVRVRPGIGDSGTIRNGIAYQSPTYSFNSQITPSYTDANSWTTAAYTGLACVTGCLTSNPLSDGTPASLKYLVRIEAGSALSGTGFGSADYGANVVKQYGCDGCFYGDASYNTLSATDLWAWPNESRIKTEMCTQPGGGLGTWDSPVAETRGFCSASSITNYIHNYMGNGSFLGPTISSIAVSPITKTTATVTWTTDIAADSTVNYGLTSAYGSSVTNASDVTSHSLNITGLTASTTYHYAVTSVDAQDNSASSTDATFVTATQNQPHMTLSSGDAQTAATGAALASDICVLYLDDDGTPLSAVTTTWTVTAGGGSVSAATSNSNASGIACITPTLGTTPGANTFRASATATGSPIDFTATATANLTVGYSFDVF